MKLLPTFDQLNAAYSDPAPSWRWILIMPSVNAQGVTVNNAPNLSRNQWDTNNKNAVLPAYQVTDASFPFVTLDTDARFYAGLNEHFPRYFQLSELSVSFYIDSAYSAFKYVQNWMSFIVDEDGNYSPRNAYAGDAVAFFYDTTDSDWRMKVTIKDMYPVSPASHNANFDGGSTMQHSCSFVCNGAKLEFQGDTPRATDGNVMQQQSDLSQNDNTWSSFSRIKPW